MTRLIQVAAELQRFLDGKSWPNCVIGGIAVLRWGEPRLTEYVDLTLLTGYGGEEPYSRRANLLLPAGSSWSRSTMASALTLPWADCPLKETSSPAPAILSSCLENVCGLVRRRI